MLVGDVKPRFRELLIQIYDAEDVRILKGVVSKDHVHVHMEYPPMVSVSDPVKGLKGRTLRLLQKEYPCLEQRYWGQHFWGVGYCNLKYHRSGSNQDQDTMMLED